MEQAKRRRMDDRMIDFNNIDDIVEHDPISLTDDEIDIPRSKEGEHCIAVGLMEDESEDLMDLLKEWNLTSFMENLISCGVTYNRLHLLRDGDYHILLKNDYTKLGDMIVFRNMHEKWNLDRQSLNDKRLNDVKYILENGGEAGAEIRNYYARNQHLVDQQRESLVDLILKENRKIPRKILSEMADQIREIFPKENEKVYYNKVRGKEPTGLLYRRYKDSRDSSKNKRRSEEMQTEDDPTSLTDELQRSVDFLTNEENFGENFDLPVVLGHWTTTFEYRNSKIYKNIDEAVDNWLPLGRIDAPAFIHRDFKQKFGSAVASSFLLKWEDFIFKNQGEILKGIRDAAERKILQTAQSRSDVNERDKAFVMALHQLSYTVPPQTKNKNSVWTPSIPESKDSFLIEVTSSSELQKRLNYQYKLCELKNFKKHPIIFDMNEKKGRRYILALGSRLYESQSIKDAVDDAFKMYVMLKIRFPPQSVRVWLLLNELFYKIDLEQPASPKIISMMDSFKF